MLRKRSLFNSFCKYAIAPLILVASVQAHIPFENGVDQSPIIPLIPPQVTMKIKNLERSKKQLSSWMRFKRGVYRLMRTIKKQIRNNEEFLKGVGMTVAAIAMFRFGGQFLSWLFPYVEFKDTVSLGSSTIKANKINLDNHIIIQQTESPHQGPRQCGYYSFYNSAALLKAHYQPDTNIAEFLQGSHAKVAEWRDFLEKQVPQQAQPATENDNKKNDPFAHDLDERMIKQLIEKEQQENGILHGLPKNYYFCITNGIQDFQLRFDHLNSPLSGANDDELLNPKAVAARNENANDVVQQILKAPVAIFILNTGQQVNKDGQPSDNNHWIMLAVSRQGEGAQERRTYTIADSINLNWLEQGVARQAIAILEQFYNNQINNKPA